MRILGFLFLSLIISTSVVVLDFYLPGTYFTDFLDNHFIETFAALVGFNIAAVIFLIGQLMVLEERFDGERFVNTKQEIKHNSYFLIFSFVGSLFLLILRPDLLQGDIRWSSNIFYYLDNILVVAVFILAIFAIYEILRAVFVLSNNNT